MSLWFLLHVNDQCIGTCEIQRQEHLDLTDRDAIADVVSTYTVKIDSLPSVEVKHRYGDGAWPLVRAALNAAFPVVNPAQLVEIEAEMNDPDAWGDPGENADWGVRWPDDPDAIDECPTEASARLIAARYPCAQLVKSIPGPWIPVTEEGT